MNKYIFCVFIFLVIIALLIVYFRKVTINFELFKCYNLTDDDKQKLQDSLNDAVEQTVKTLGDNINENKSSTKVTRKSFIMFEDRFYLISIDRKIFCKYISGGDWFRLCDNYQASDYASTPLKDLTVLRDSSNKLYIYALFGNFICRKLVDDSDDTWEYLSELGLGNINQITSNKDTLLINVLNETDTDEESNPIGIYSYTISNGNLTQITPNTNYINIRINPYSSESFFYGLFKEDNGDIIAVKKSFEGDDDYDDSFDFGEVTFVDLCVSNNFLYGLGDDKYVYRKSIRIDVVGNESYSWNKVTTALDSSASLKSNIKKKISIYKGYIYCLDNETVKKHQINGYSWISINDFKFDNQYYSYPPAKVLERVHKDTDTNMDPDLKDFIPMKRFSFGIN